jgi:hypothetical protein
VFKRVSRRGTVISAVLMGATVLMVMSVPAASAESDIQLQNSHSHKCMTNGGSSANSAPITQYTCMGGDPNQYWSTVDDTIVSEDSNKCLSNGGATNNGAAITQYTCNGSPNQTWYQEENSNGTYTFDNGAGICITTGESLGNSAPIVQYACDGSSSQQWSEI